MRKWTVRAARTALVAAAFVAAGTGIANADSDGNSQNGLVNVPINGPIAPITVAGNGLGLLGQGAVR
jgi:hypothetical protein